MSSCRPCTSCGPMSRRCSPGRIGTDPDNSDVHYLAEAQRQATRPLILAADAGMTGCNFAVAETGSVVVCTNEGNADLSANVPKLHIASIGIEKIIPRLEHLAVFVRLLSRSALGSPITQYTSHFRGPRAGGEMHIVLVDNGRSERLGLEEFWTSLKCIRCGACMNTCPVYRRSGGLSYGATYSGPIGLIIDPTFNARKYSNLPFASTLNGSCTNVCPVKINIHEQIYAWRRELVKQHEVPFVKKAAMKAAGELLSHPAAYRAAIAAADIALAHLPRFVIYNGLNAWGKHREVPHPPEQTFHSWYHANRGESHEQPRRNPGLDPRQPAAGWTGRFPPFRCSTSRAGLAARRPSRTASSAWAGMFLDPPASRGSRWRRSARSSPHAKVVCSTVPEIAGNRDIAGSRRAAGSRGRGFRDRARGFRRRRDGLRAAERQQTSASMRVAYLAQHLIVLLDPGRYCRQSASRLSPARSFATAHYACFHTGPSATADIEGVLIHGAQGVRSLSVLPIARSLSSIDPTDRRRQS